MKTSNLHIEVLFTPFPNEISNQEKAQRQWATGRLSMPITLMEIFFVAQKADSPTDSPAFPMVCTGASSSCVGTADGFYNRCFFGIIDSAASKQPKKRTKNHQTSSHTALRLPEVVDCLAFASLKYSSSWGNSHDRPEHCCQVWRIKSHMPIDVERDLFLASKTPFPIIQCILGPRPRHKAPQLEPTIQLEQLPWNQVIGVWWGWKTVNCRNERTFNRQFFWIFCFKLTARFQDHNDKNRPKNHQAQGCFSKNQAGQPWFLTKLITLLSKPGKVWLKLLHPPWFLISSQVNKFMKHHQSTIPRSHRWCENRLLKIISGLPAQKGLWCY